MSNKPALVQTMTVCRTGDRTLTEPMLGKVMHIPYAFLGLDEMTNWTHIVIGYLGGTLLVEVLNWTIYFFQCIKQL